MSNICHISQNSSLPPDLSAFQKAEPGDYRLRSTGEVVINPDFTVLWTVQPPSPDLDES
ncbi:MAG: hypothetical protein ACFFC7_00125 [Candidatus Hermodarchaeota archaeon]